MEARISDIPSDELHVGDRFGPFEYKVDDSVANDWATVFDGRSESTEYLSPGAMTLYYLKCAMDAFDGIPRGAILARQSYDFYSAPSVGGTLTTNLEILNKEVRKNRTWITFVVDVSADSRSVSTSQLTWIWGN